MILLLLALAIVSLLVFLFLNAPQGYEDARGFHYGKPSRSSDHMMEGL